MNKLITLSDIIEKVHSYKDIFGKIDYVVGVARDGLIFAAVLSLELDIPLFIADVNRLTKQVKFWPKKPKGIGLVADDVARTGSTLGLIVGKLHCKSILMFTDYPELTDYTLFASDGKTWYIPEWEFAIENRKFKTGYDLDGIICEDAPRWQRPFLWLGIFRYFSQLHRELAHRPNPDALIATGRIEADKKATQYWLKRHQIDNPVIYNKGEFTLENIIRTKEQAIKSHKVEMFFESDEFQAMELQSRCPGVSICWWRNGASEWKR